jgi:hypothetical protein
MTNSSPRLLIKNGTVIDGSGRDPVTNTLVVVEGNRISHAGRGDGSLRPESPDDTVIDEAREDELARGIDAHCHISLHQGALPGVRYTSRAPSFAPCGRRMRSAGCCAPASPASPSLAANGSPM